MDLSRYQPPFYEAIGGALYVQDRRGSWHITNEDGTLCGKVVPGEPENDKDYYKPLCGKCVAQEISYVHQAAGRGK